MIIKESDIAGNPVSGASRRPCDRALYALPHWTITLTHDVRSNMAVLDKVR